MDTLNREPEETVSGHISTLLLRAKQMRGCKVLVVGDIMLDSYLEGTADRISPEAPVPVVHVRQEKRFLGGAGNVAKNIVALGGKAMVVGLRGADSTGELLEQDLSAEHIEHDLLILPQRETTLKIRVVASRQQIVRVDREDASPLSAQDTDKAIQKITAQLPEVGAIIVSDYGKGLVSSYFMSELRRAAEAYPRKIPILVDPKPKNFSCYAGVTLITPNAKEAQESTGMPVGTKEEIIAAGREILARLNCRHVMITLGSRGMVVFSSPDVIWHVPTVAQKVFDVTGAGDTVIALTGLGLAAGLHLVESSLLANYAAGVVVGEVGTATVTQELLENAVRQLPALHPDLWGVT